MCSVVDHCALHSSPCRSGTLLDLSCQLWVPVVSECRQQQALVCCLSACLLALSLAFLLLPRPTTYRAWVLSATAKEVGWQPASAAATCAASYQSSLLPRCQCQCCSTCRPSRQQVGAHSSTSACSKRRSSSSSSRSSSSRCSSSCRAITCWYSGRSSSAQQAVHTTGASRCASAWSDGTCPIRHVFTGHAGCKKNPWVLLGLLLVVLVFITDRDSMRSWCTWLAWPQEPAGSCVGARPCEAGGRAIAHRGLWLPYATVLVSSQRSVRNSSGARQPTRLPL